MIEMACENCW